MGGHTLYKNGILLNMKKFNNIIKLNQNTHSVTVQSGLLWSDLIKYLNNFGLAPMTLQSYSSFSIGGSISVNVHGITNDDSIYKSVIEIGIINANGQLKICNRNKNNELFSLIIGGYGLFCVIVWIKLKVIPNVKLYLERCVF